MSVVPQIECPFEDWDAFQLKDPTGTLGYPRLAVIDDDWVLASTWMGRCFVLDLREKTCMPCPLVIRDIGSTGLVSPSAVLIDTGCVCAAAMRTAYACIWHLGDKTPVAIYPKRQSPVSAVALHPSGKLVALGLGYYSLSAFESKAGVELWTVEESPVCIASCRFPGVSIDNLVWDIERDALFVVSGNYQQNSGHVAILDGESLCTREMESLDFAICKAAQFCRGGLFLVARNQIELRHADDLEVINSLDSNDTAVGNQLLSLEDITQAASFHGQNHLVLNNGLVVDLEEEDHGMLPALPQCTGIAVMPNGDGVGIASNGVVRIWQQPLNSLQNGL